MKKYSVIFVYLLLLLLAGIGPNLFVIAQAGIASMHFLGIYILLPSVGVTFLLLGVTRKTGIHLPVKLAFNGLAAGLLATVGLEIVREAGFQLGTMPGDLPKLMGVLLLDQFSSGPDIWSNLAGWAYHFWNGAAFGMIFSLILGQPKIWQGLVFGILIGIVFMISPVVIALGIERFGLQFKDGYQFAATVTLAHAAYGVLLAAILKRTNKANKGMIDLVKSPI